MTTPAKLNEYNHAEKPARQLLERLGWAYVPRETLAAERGDEREALLKGRLRGALLRLNEWMMGLGFLNLGYNSPNLWVPAELLKIWRKSARRCKPEEVDSP